MCKNRVEPASGDAKFSAKMSVQKSRHRTSNHVRKQNMVLGRGITKIRVQITGCAFLNLQLLF